MPNDKTVDMAIAWALGLVLGFAIGHVQQYNWTAKREHALITQIKKQDCDELTIDKWRKRRDARENKAYASAKK